MAYKLEGLLCPFERSHSQSNSLLNEKNKFELLKFYAFDNHLVYQINNFLVFSFKRHMKYKTMTFGRTTKCLIWGYQPILWTTLPLPTIFSNSLKRHVLHFHNNI